MEMNAFKIGDTVLMDGEEYEVVQLFEHERRIIICHTETAERMTVSPEDLHL